MGPRFCAGPPDALATVLLENLVAVFHAPSGMTHLLAPPAPQILAMLGEGPADIDEILARLARAHEFEASEARAAIAARLAELEESGLVRRA